MKPCAVDVDGTGNAGGGARLAICEPVFAQPRAIDLEQLDVDDDFRPCLVDRRDQARPRPRYVPACP